MYCSLQDLFFTLRLFKYIGDSRNGGFSPIFIMKKFQVHRKCCILPTYIQQLLRTCHICFLFTFFICSFPWPFKITHITFHQYFNMHLLKIREFFFIAMPPFTDLRKLTISVFWFYFCCTKDQSQGLMHTLPLSHIPSPWQYLSITELVHIEIYPTVPKMSTNMEP